MLELAERNPLSHAVSPFLEMGAYEALWLERGAGFKSIADKFRSDPAATPSDLVSHDKAFALANEVDAKFRDAGISEYGVKVRGAGEYPVRLQDADHPVELLYYQGWWELVNIPSIAVVGSRKVSEEGIRRTRRLTQGLVELGYAIVSGLAEGVDTAAHTTALDMGGVTIGILGTPLHKFYPKANIELQKRIAKEFLLISQVPALRHDNGNPRINRFFFPARNVTMSALTGGTVIVEASDTSGTLHQARAAISQGRKLFILNSCFENKDITWPEKYLKKGAIRVSGIEDIVENLHVGNHKAYSNR